MGSCGAGLSRFQFIVAFLSSIVKESLPNILLQGKTLDEGRLTRQEKME
jgi:hypothetical protein